MKSYAAALGVTCVVLAVGTGWLTRVALVNRKVIKDLDSANLVLAYTLLAEGIENNTINVFAGPNASRSSFSTNGFVINVIPLRTEVEDPTWGAVNFLAHNHQAIWMHALHMWDSNRGLALTELKLISNVFPKARLFLEAGEHGDVAEQGRSMIQLHESKWNWFLARFMREGHREDQVH